MDLSLSKSFNEVPQSYLIFLLIWLRRLFTHVVACVRDTLELPFTDLLIPMNVLFYHLLNNTNTFGLWKLCHKSITESNKNTWCTVVPAMCDPCRERPPDVYGHVINVPAHLNVKLPAIGGHLPNADSNLLVVRTCYKRTVKTNATFWLVISTQNRSRRAP